MMRRSGSAGALGEQSPGATRPFGHPQYVGACLGMGTAWPLRHCQGCGEEPQPESKSRD